MAGAAFAAFATAAPAQDVTELAELSIEELTQVEVTSASKRAEPIAQVPNAIYVITEEDIARSPATSLPELLRQAPNLQVQRVDARQYAISARGFNGIETSNKLLAQIDGRSIYTTLASSVFWELHSPLLEDLQQIEVISGPGGTLYGPNAVNGVINITSKDAHDTVGGLVRGTAGANEQTLGLRYGAGFGESGAFRVYANGFNRDGLPQGLGPDLDDDFKGYQAGFRADFGGGDDHFTVQGDIFDTDSDVVRGDGDEGHNLLARWTRATGAESSLQVQAYYDKFERRTLLTMDSLETFDVQAQYNGSVANNEFVLGAGVRTTRDNFVNNLNGFKLVPQSRRLWVGNLFLQDRIALTDTLALIAGAKLEGSTFAGVELLPNLRLAWQPNDRTLFWSAVSRAVRTPSRIDRQLQFLPILAPADDFKSEKLIAIEAGYRGQPSDRTTLSVSIFYNIYDDLRTTEATPVTIFPIQLDNGIKGHSYGIEAWGTQQIASWWRLSLGLSTLGKDFELKQGHSDLGNFGSLGDDPDYQILARSRMNLGNRVELDIGMRAVDDLENPAVDGYVEADARLAWQATDALELFVAGTSLLHQDHLESNDVQRGQLVERSVYAGTRIAF